MSASTTAPTSSANYDRPNRLKGREDSGIKWQELLEKFRSVQERARRIQRQNLEGDDVSVAALNDLRIGDGAAESKSNNRAAATAGGAAPANPAKEAVPVPAVKRSSLGRQFGRLGGAVSGKNRRN